MNFSLVTTQPIWFLVFCILLGWGGATLLYRKSPLVGEVSRLTGRILFGTRFLLLTLLSFLLLEPMLRTLTREVEKPLVIIALDESQSVVNRADSIAAKKAIRADLENLQNSLGDDFDVRTFSFGDKVSTDINYRFTGRTTNFSDLFRELDVRFSNRNVGTMILASDGLYNEGSSPAYGPARLRLPVYSIALGDTTSRRDVFIADVRHNRFAYLGNSFPLEINLRARQCAGEKLVLTVEKDSQLLVNRAFPITGRDFQTIVPVYLDAKAKGIQHFVVRVSALEGEVTLVNNQRDVFIEVVEEKQKVLVLAAGPHPDLSAIRQSLESTLNTDVKVHMAFDSPWPALSDYHVVVLHNLPSAATGSLEAWKRKIEEAPSVLYVVGPGTTLELLNALNPAVTVSQSNAQLNDAQAVFAGDFPLFQTGEEIRSVVSNWPPLKSPFGVYQAHPSAVVMLQQRIGSVNTGQPLLAFLESEGRKNAVLCGEGLWKWRLADYQENGQHRMAQDLIRSIIQYLSIKEKKSPLILQSKSDYRENEPVLFNARLLNASGQLVNEPEVRVRINSADGKEYLYAMSRVDNAYVLNAGILPVGRYRYVAETRLGTAALKESGAFSVSALQLEKANTQADHRVLNILASKTGGRVFYSGQSDELIKAIRSNESIKPVSYLNKRFRELIDEPVFMALVLFLLGIEWFLRKRSGSY